MAREKRLIDVNKVIASMQKCLDEAPDKKDTVAYFAFESIITALKQEPTVDAVEVVHGRWILTHGEDGLYYDCSICGHCAGRGRKSNYCPNCGAKMDGDGNG